ETIAKRFGVDNPQIEIKEITTPDLDAKSVADKMKNMIERGFAWRSVAFRTLQDIERAGAVGMEIILTGKLAGKGGRKRKVRFSKGYMKKVGDQVKLVDEAKVTTYPKVGAIGVTIRIIRPDVFFPDKIDVKQTLADRATAAVVATGAMEKTTVVTPKKEPVISEAAIAPTPEEIKAGIKVVEETVTESDDNDVLDAPADVKKGDAA
ncbi:MAG: hypothetical protein AABY11_03320, partial [archaeon]